MSKVELSDTTKKYKKLYYLWLIMSIVATFLPVLVYTVAGFIEAETTQKLSLGMTCFIAIALVAVNVLMKKHLRSPIWILVLGIYMCIKNILPLLLLVAIGTILDEFLFTPLYRSYKQKASINKEIDRRM